MKKVIAFLFAVVAAVSIASAADKNDKVYVRTLTDENYQSVLGNIAHPVVIDFSATWCGPCKMFAPIFHETAKEYDNRVEFFTVDVDQSPNLAKMFNVMAVPTIFIVNPTNNKVDYLQGLVSKEDFVKRIDANL